MVLVLVTSIMMFVWEFSAQAGIQGWMPFLVSAGCAAGAALVSFFVVKLRR